MNKRGRPKVAPSSPQVFMNDVNLPDLSSKIADLLGIKIGLLSDELAEAAGHYPNTKTIRNQGSLSVKRKGNRPNIHLSILLRDCALAYQNQTGKSAKAELLKIGGRTEDSSEIIEYARAILTAIGENHPQSLRQQAKQAADRYF